MVASDRRALRRIPCTDYPLPSTVDRPLGFIDHPSSPRSHRIDSLPTMTARLRTRFLVIGSGIAGLHSAWRASDHGDVVVVTKRTLFESSTAYAQGGIAAALGAGDSPELHRQDTLAAGAALCDRAAVEVLVEEGPARVRELQAAGAAFDLAPDGKFLL